MKYIEKKIENEPDSLKRTRSTPGSTYNDVNRVDVRNSLLTEQGGICAYCMQRISDKLDDKGQPLTTIEHYVAQKADEGEGNELTMNYMNMLGICRGNDGSPKHLQHCGNRRGKTPLSIDPRNPICETLIKYEDTTGKIYSDNPNIDKDLNETLGLNGENLINNRKRIISIARLVMQNKYKKKKNKSWSKSDLQSEINRWKSKSDKYEEYCMAAVFYLERKLARL